MSLRVSLSLLCCAAPACESASFESLGTLPAPQIADAGVRDAAVPPLQLDAAMVTRASAGSDAGIAADSGRMGAAGMPAAAGSNVVVAPAALSGTLEGMPFAVMSGYVSGLADEFQQTSVYLFDSTVSCSQLSTFAWLAQLPSTTRVLEVTYPATATTGSPVSNASVSSMRGGTYAFSKTRASSSTLTLSHVTQVGDVDGLLTVSFGAGSLAGVFHADYCARGMGL